MAGSGSRGRPGRTCFSRALGQPPPDLPRENAAFGGRVVEYALRLPGGRLLPIDSKWTGVAEPRAPGDDRRPRGRAAACAEQLAREVRWREGDGEVPRLRADPVFRACWPCPTPCTTRCRRCAAEGWRKGVLVVPYSLGASRSCSPLYRLVVRFAPAPSRGGGRRACRALDELLQRPGRRARGAPVAGLVQAANARMRCAHDLGRSRPGGDSGPARAGDN